ncbi:hypothetical protein CPB84DRAFT_1792695 [Gymnopilus junonius]|uniref:IBR domain-containing protein n=1 Tax=Gymnopilus junonius TaxID=109634 RepID=A0A9P5NCB9_GYMJU|nr:hypothetical protein CPB84DRAFT_1792695 [Gymnopilus junonius]
MDGKTFPLVCAGNDATFHALVDSAFSVYIEQHGQEFKYCTTPDCKQIYRRRNDQRALQCPSCFSTICSACDEEAHEGMTCEERRIHKNPENKNSGYKKCHHICHMQEAHGNIYDNVPEGVQMGNMVHNAFLANQVDELARIQRLGEFRRQQEEADRQRLEI